MNALAKSIITGCRVFVLLVGICLIYVNIDQRDTLPYFREISIVGIVYILAAILAEYRKSFLLYLVSTVTGFFVVFSVVSLVTFSNSTPSWLLIVLLFIITIAGWIGTTNAD